ncbi:hypothetical protein TNCV_4438851 [Trichonephila clavipes]|nr:hypothetical protein TNCV_4438851 [Trichonephila clavipes]
MPTDRPKRHIEAQDVNHGKGIVVRLSLTVALSIIWVTIRFGSIPPNFEEHPGVVRCNPPLFSFRQSHERTCSSTAVKSTPSHKGHYTLTNIHAFSGIQTQVLRHSSQRR